MGEAGGPADALRTVERTRPEVVLLDLKLSAEDGLDLLRGLRAQIDHPPESASADAPIRVDAREGH